MEQGRERVISSSATRCPFCRDSVDPTAAEWVCCAQCLTRHHTPCWSESGNCASCGHGGKLEPSEASAPLGTPLPADPMTRTQRNTARALAEHRDRPTPLQWAKRLVPYPLYGGDVELSAHREANRSEIPHVPAGLEPPLWARLSESREHAVEGGRGRLARRLRMWLPLFVGFAGLIALAVATGRMVDHWDRHLGTWLTRNVLPVGIAQAVTVLGYWVYQGLFRESVVRHEANQSFVTLVAGAVPSKAAQAFEGRLRLVWRLRRFQDLGLALGCLLIPILGGVAAPLVAFLRSAGTLRQHVHHEESLRREVAGYGREEELK